MLLPFIVGFAELRNPGHEVVTASVPTARQMRGIFHTPGEMICSNILLRITNSVRGSASSFAM